MTDPTSADARVELIAAEKALADFDASTLVAEDGSPNEEAQAALKRLHDRVAAARARMETAA